MAALSLALLVSFMLFLLMQRLVTTRDGGMSQPVDYGQLEFVRLRRETPVVEKKRIRPQRPKNLDAPSQPTMDVAEAVQQSRSAVPTAVPLPESVAKVGAEGLRLRGGPKLGMSMSRDGAAVPLVRVDPEYPRTARQDRIEGYVRVRFDIGPTGRVLNPEVLDASPTGVFEQAALRAFSRWKYRPQIVNGEAVVQRNQIAKIVFELER